MKRLVFVYGTLKEGRGNHPILGDSTPLGPAITEESFYMTTVGFPYMIPAEEAKGYEALPVLGEVYEVTEQEVMQRLDWLEGVEHNHYKHYEMEVNLVGSDETVEVLAYVPFDTEDAVDRTKPVQPSSFQEQQVYNF